MAHYPLVRNLKLLPLWLIAFVLLIAAILFQPPLFYIICFLSPVMLAVCGISAGIVPMTVFSLVLPVVAWLLFGETLTPALCAIYLVPFLIVHIYCFARKVPFWHMAAAHIAALAISQTAILAILRHFVGGNLFVGGADYLVQLVAESPNGNELLLLLHRLNLLQLPEGMISAINFSIAQVMMPKARIELLNGLRTFLELYLPVLLPTVIVNNAILAGVFGVAFPLLAARRLKVDVVQMEPFATWHLSSSAGVVVFLLGLGNLLSSGFPNSYLSLAGMMMSEAFFIVFAIQGAAIIDFFRARTGAYTSFRWLWPCAVFITIPWLLMIIGIADQIMNFRGLRKPKNREEI